MRRGPKPVGPDSLRAAFFNVSPDGKQVLYVVDRGGGIEDLAVVPFAGGAARTLIAGGGYVGAPYWSPDGSKIVFTSDRGGRPQIYRIAADGGKPERVTFDGRYNARASFSPDGKRITFINGDGNVFKVAVMELATGNMQILTNSRLDESPSFSPNGSMIIYATEHANRGVLAAVSLDGRVQQRIQLQEAGDAREPVWGPFTK